mmetsp:Transcript_13495/g.44449  ORF Transcript_13495/g.44449 Transcript_13495/m.44449 type:complete len:395 (-) Transcript_13495:233-1417(-)
MRRSAPDVTKERRCATSSGSARANSASTWRTSSGGVSAATKGSSAPRSPQCRTIVLNASLLFSLSALALGAWMYAARSVLSAPASASGCANSAPCFPTCTSDHAAATRTVSATPAPVALTSALPASAATTIEAFAFLKSARCPRTRVAGSAAGLPASSERFCTKQLAAPSVAKEFARSAVLDTISRVRMAAAERTAGEVSTRAARTWGMTAPLPTTTPAISSSCFATCPSARIAAALNLGGPGLGAASSASGATTSASTTLRVTSAEYEHVSARRLATAPLSRAVAPGDSRHSLSLLSVGSSSISFTTGSPASTSVVSVFTAASRTSVSSESISARKGASTPADRHDCAHPSSVLATACTAPFAATCTCCFACDSEPITLPITSPCTSPDAVGA